MIRHPMQKCPAEFVPVFQEILENSHWESLGPVYICHRVDRIYRCDRITGGQHFSIVQWIAECLQGNYSFHGWLWDTYPHNAHLMEVNQCRKAWLEWLVSPEGHE